jgi:hypothetical protein
MSNRAVVLQKLVPNDPEAGLALVTKPVPKAEPGQVVVRIILRALNPTDLLSYRFSGYAHAKPGSFTPGSEGVGIVHDVRNSFHALLASFPLVALKFSRSLLWSYTQHDCCVIDCSSYRAHIIALFKCVFACKLFLKMPAGRRGSDNSGERPKSCAIRTS